MIRTTLPIQEELDLMFPKEKVIISSSIPVLLDLEGKEVRIQAPVFSPESIRAGDCSRYARYVAKILFGKNFAICDGWDRRYLDRIVCEIREEGIMGLAEREALTPGQIIGISYPQSRHKDTLDLTRNKAKYTHNALYLGRRPNLNNNDLADLLLFAEQFITETRVVTARQIYEKGLIPLEVLDTN